MFLIINIIKDKYKFYKQKFDRKKNIKKLVQSPKMLILSKNYK